MTKLAPTLSCLLLTTAALAQIDDERERARARYARVEAELRAAGDAGRDNTQQAARAQVLEWLREYRERGDFGIDTSGGNARVPLFVDASGRRCAVAFLLDRSGHGTLTTQIAAHHNDAWLVELAANPQLRAWLAASGLTLAEAARVQGPGITGRAERNTMRIPPPPRTPPADWTGPEDARPAGPGVAAGAGGGRTAGGGRARGANMSNVATTSSSADRGRTWGGAAGSGSQRGIPAAETTSDWLAWWHAGRSAYLHTDRGARAALTAQEAAQARDAARQAFLPELLAVATDDDAQLRAAATLALGRLGEESHLSALQPRLQDPQQGIRYWALLSIGALGGPRAGFLLSTIAADVANEPRAIGPAARAFAVLGLALTRGAYDTGLIAGLAEHAPTHDDDGLRLASLLYAELIDPALLGDLASTLLADRDLILRSRALESMAGVATDTAVGTLTRVLSGPHAELRRSAALALGQCRHELALPALLTAFDLEREHLTRGVLLLAIGAHQEPEARKFLCAELRGGPKALRAWAALGLGLALRNADDAVARTCLRAAQAAEKNDSAAGAYLLALGLARDTEALPILQAAMRADGEASMRLIAADALALIASDVARAILREQVRLDACYSTRAAMAELLCGIGDEDDIAAVRARLQFAAHDQEKAAFALALGARFSPDSAARLREVVRDAKQSTPLRAAAVHALGRMLDDRVAHRLAALTRCSNWRLRPQWLDVLVQSTL